QSGRQPLIQAHAMGGCVGLQHFALPRVFPIASVFAIRSLHYEPFRDRTAMTGETPAHLDEEKPLDPAAENVRRKMLRFMFINLGILFLALMAVMIALVYKSF